MKPRLRLKARELAQVITPTWRKAASTQIASQLRQYLSQLSFVHIGLYMPLPDEPDLGELIPALRLEGKKIYLPRVLDKEEIAFYAFSEGDPLDKRGVFGIAEPSPHKGTKATRPLDVLVVPAVHFHNNYRLGRGKGYYDRYIAQHPPGILIGVSLGLLGETPFTPDVWDKPMQICFFPQMN